MIKTFRFAEFCLCALLALGLQGCTSDSYYLPRLPDAQADGQSYRLAPGDVVNVAVFDVPALSGDFPLDEAGRLTLPLIGSVEANNLTLAELSGRLGKAFSGKYMKDPSVTLRIAQYRHFFVIGEVVRPGDYSYALGMNVINAVAMAGGFSYRADHDDVTVTRAGMPYRGTASSTIQPGDTVQIGERVF